MRNLLLAATALFPLATLAPAQAGAATYTVVAPGTTPAAGQFSSLNALAIAQSNAPFLQPGDVIDMRAGTYIGDEGRFYNIGTPASPVTFQAVGGYVYMPTLKGAANGKGTLDFVSSDVVVSGFVFAGYPYGSASNEAGIRLDVNYGQVDANGLPYPYNLTVKNSGFIMKGDGILADDCSTSHTLSGQYGATSAGIAYTNGTCSISIDGSYFAGNGGGDGLEHGIYIDRIDQLTVTNSLFLGGLDGHLIKSRAFNSDIENDRLISGPFAFTNTLIDFPVGGIETLKNNVLELGAHNDGNGFVDYNTENYPPTLNNVGQSVTMTGNTFIDDWSGGVGYTAMIFMDQSLAASTQTPPGTHSPTGAVAALTFTGNHLYGPKWTTTNIGGGWRGITIDSSNTLDNNMADAPALDTTAPIAWPTGTSTETLTITGNGYELGAGGVHDTTSTTLSDYPQFAIFWNGVVVPPAPATVQADEKASPQAVSTLTFQVPVIPGAPQFMQPFDLNPGCCNNAIAGQGRDLNLLTAALGTQTINPLSDWAGNSTVFAATAPATTPPVLATPAALTLTAGATAPIVLSATDANATAAQLTYKVTTAPAHGTIKVNGVAATRWTQAQVTAGLVTYTATGTAAATDAIGFLLFDPAGNTVTGTLPITINAAAASTPPAGPTIADSSETLSVAAGATVVLSLAATDPNATAAQLTYKVTLAPKQGVIKDKGVTASNFTQADVAAGLVTYTSTGTAAASDQVNLSVYDPAGSGASAVLTIAVTAAAGCG